MGVQLNRIERDERVTLKARAFYPLPTDDFRPLPESQLAALQAQGRTVSDFHRAGRPPVGKRHGPWSGDRSEAPRWIAMTSGSRTNAKAATANATMLRTAMGPRIAAALADPAVIEVMVNPDGALRLDRLGEGRIDTGVRIAPSRSRTDHPPGGIAYCGWKSMPTIPSSAPNCRHWATGSRRTLRRPAAARFAGAVLLDPQTRSEDLHARRLCDRPHPDGQRRRTCFSAQSPTRKNILIAGGTSSGKTTLANALLAEIAQHDERVIVIEDTRELQCAAPDCVSAAHQTRRRVTLRTWCARRCGFGRTASSSAKCAAPKPSTCSRRGTPAIPAASPRFMPIPRAPRSTGSNSSFRKPSSPCRAG